MDNFFSKKIVEWYKNNKRDLPWRNTKDPYLVWLSEIILQQTRVEQGLPYYRRYIEHFPTVQHLSKATEEKVLKLWQGLGYYSRARNLHAASKYLVEHFNGRFPEKYEDILQLKGVGEYTAAAIASFSYDQPYAVVDGNVYRVLSRVFGIKSPIDSTEGKKQFKAVAQELIDKKDPGIYNQAIMEFGAMWCKPRLPDCKNCCLNNICVAYEKKMVDMLPVKGKKIKQGERYFNYLVIRNNKKTYLRKRTDKDIWQGLYDFPLIESNRSLSEYVLFRSKEWSSFFGKNKYILKSISKIYKHVLSHQKIYARFFEVEMKKPLNKKQTADLIYISDAAFKKYAIPRLIDIYLKEHSKS